MAGHRTVEIVMTCKEDERKIYIGRLIIYDKILYHISSGASIQDGVTDALGKFFIHKEKNYS